MMDDQEKEVAEKSGQVQGSGLTSLRLALAVLQREYLEAPRGVGIAAIQYVEAAISVLEDNPAVVDDGATTK